MNTPTSPQALARALLLREDIAKAIYELDPFHEGGEYVDHFMVSPGGDLTWEQAKARDAEFAGDRIMLPVTKFAYDAADAVLASSNLTALVTWALEMEARNAELEKALTDARTWHEAEDKALSKQPPSHGPNGNQWTRLQHREQIDLLTAAIAGKQS